MSQDSFISLNIVKDNVLQYKNFPIIFYWNGTDDVILNIKENDKFKAIVEKYLNSNDYDSVSLYLTYVNVDKYNEKEIKLQDIYPLTECEVSYNNVILNIFYDVYYKVFKKQYEIPIDDFGYNDILFDIYEDIQNRLNISKQTFINYVRSKLDEKTKLTYSNKEYILTDILN